MWSFRAGLIARRVDMGEKVAFRAGNRSFTMAAEFAVVCPFKRPLWAL